MSDDKSEDGKTPDKSKDSPVPISSWTFTWNVKYSNSDKEDGQVQVPVKTGLGAPTMTWTFSINHTNGILTYECKTENGDSIPLYKVEAKVDSKEPQKAAVYRSEIKCQKEGRFDFPGVFRYKPIGLTITLTFYNCNHVLPGVINFANDWWNARHEHAINMRLLEMLNTGHQSDAKIISSDGQEFLVHKLILRAGNEVFDAMFRHDMVESNSGIVTFKDMSARAVKFLLHFIYTSQILKISAVENDKIGTNATMEEVLYLAAKFRLQELLTYLDKNIPEFCEKENAWHLFKLCKLYSLEKGKKEIFDFMMKNNTNFIEEMLTSQA